MLNDLELTEHSPPYQVSITNKYKLYRGNIELNYNYLDIIIFRVCPDIVTITK